MIAANNVNISSEVTGDVLAGSVPLKKGSQFSSGQLLFSIDNQEAQYSLYAQKSEFLTALATILADIKIDFPDSYQMWLDYFNSIEVDMDIPELPESSNSAEKTFLATKGILNQYYSIVSAEERLAKYNIYAPYNGVIKEVYVESGGTVNPGTAIINISSSNQIEIEIPVKKVDLDYINTGDLAMVGIPGQDSFVNGSVSRVSEIIDVRTQSFLAFVKVPGSSPLKEGMYTQVQIVGGEIENSISIPRKAIFEKEFVYVVRDSLLAVSNVQVLREGTKENIVSGLQEGDQVVVDALVNAYDGMQVVPLTQENIAE